MQQCQNGNHCILWWGQFRRSCLDKRAIIPLPCGKPPRHKWVFSCTTAILLVRANVDPDLRFGPEKGFMISMVLVLSIFPFRGPLAVVPVPIPFCLCSTLPSASSTSPIILTAGGTGKLLIMVAGRLNLFHQFSGSMQTCMLLEHLLQ